MTNQVRKSFDCYRSENPSVLTSLARMLKGALYVALPLYTSAVTIELSRERADQVKP